jgi:hypothetical protein
VNVGQARLANLEKDLKLEGNQFDIALTVFFVPIVVVELASNLAFRWFKPHQCVKLDVLTTNAHHDNSPARWITFMMVSWSIIIGKSLGGTLAASNI